MGAGVVSRTPVPLGPPKIYLLKSGLELTREPGPNPRKYIYAKIGATARGVKTRIKELQTGNPKELRLLHQVQTALRGPAKDMYTAEEALHRKYQQFGGPYIKEQDRKSLPRPLAAGGTEWFVFPVDMLDDIKNEMNEWRNNEHANLS